MMTKTIDELRAWAVDKGRFTTLSDFTDFAREFVAYRAEDNFQAELVAANTPQYRFFQYREDAGYNITRPINTKLFYEADEFDEAVGMFEGALALVEQQAADEVEAGEAAAIQRVIYTTQQSIGAALDAISTSNRARKVNGDLFERFIGLAVQRCGVECRSGVVKVPVREAGSASFEINYQHDLMLEVDGELKAIGSVKTSSKDRVDKVFLDKFMYTQLTEVATPHFAIFLNDVQRAGREPKYRTSNTFLPGKFKGYTVKLNPLDGVYYCDLLPMMETDPVFRDHIDTIDKFFLRDLGSFMTTPENSDVETDTESIVEGTK